MRASQPILRYARPRSDQRVLRVNRLVLADVAAVDGQDRSVPALVETIASLLVVPPYQARRD